MTYNFDQIVDRTGTDCEKVDSLQRIFGRTDLIPLWVADMDFQTPDFVMEAIGKRAQHPVLGYSYRSPAYEEAIVNWVQRRGRWTVKPAWIAFSPGTVAAISFAIRGFSKPGDKILIQPPVYRPFMYIVEANDREVVRNEIRFDPVTGRGEINFEDFEEKLQGCRVFILCNPHNPSGRVFTPTELERMGQLCVKHDVLIVSDEVHCDLIQKPYQHTHIAALSEEIARRTITILSAAKSFNVAGLSHSVVLIPDREVMTVFRRAADAAHVEQGNIFGQVALQAAWTYGDAWLDALNDYLRGTMDYVLDFLHEKMPEVICYRPEATYLMWLDFRAWGLTHKELFRFTMEEAHLALDEGEFFGKEGAGYMRINIASPRSVIVRAMDQLYDAYCRKILKNT